MDWIEFYKTNLPLRDHINICTANIAYTIAAANRGKGQKLIKLDKFVLDFNRSVEQSKENVADGLNSFFGGLAKKGLLNG